MNRRPVLFVALAIGLAAAQPARAAWPTDKPIQLVVPYAPGAPSWARP
jgi:tripartite-type tricarboxylate transporter receptor subunit TctC